ncbi:MAG TPA: prepilin-type N-terminal cleavage/methylation domain-containing protein [Acidimicrobiales bacterium]|nr:prepilin-type N-terminal cleavage/methylation domain-containing protein [Acidimicrobiales bacterium]
MTRRSRWAHPVAVARRATRRRLEGNDETGFTLIELIVTVAILPIVVGGISVALISVFSLQGSVNNRISNSNDSLVASAYFNRDVQSAEQMTTAPTVACGPNPAPTSPAQTQLLGLRLAANTTAPGGYDTVVSYVSVPTINPQTNTTTYAMLRQVCKYISGSTLNLTSTITVAHDVGSAPSLAITGANNANVTASFAPSTSNPSGWKSAQGVTGVTFTITTCSATTTVCKTPGSQYTYSLTGLPGESTSQSSVSNLTNSSGPQCGFASTGSGTYANRLCFADFTGLTNIPLQSSGTCQTVTRPVANTPYSLTFCIAVSPQNVVPANIPTYYSPQGDDSEAFLGNNGFYTGIPGEPALYETSGGVTTVYITKIQVLDAAGLPATGWTLVTGDAESTDAGEWMAFQSSVNWSILPNNGISNLWGNACYDTKYSANNGALQYTGSMPPTDATVASSTAPLSINSTTFATGVTSIVCASSTQLNKTGTMMLQAQEPTGSFAPQSLTVSMRGAGLEAMFLGVLV